jgi:hypothetical protein
MTERPAFCSSQCCSLSPRVRKGSSKCRVGGSFTDDNDVELSVPGASVEFSTEYEDSVTGGGRAGYWFDSVPWLGSQRMSPTSRLTTTPAARSTT